MVVSSATELRKMKGISENQALRGRVFGWWFQLVGDFQHLERKHFGPVSGLLFEEQDLT